MVSEALTKLGLNVVSIEPDAAIIAFRDNPSLSEFREAVEKFEAGPRPGINETTGEPFKGTGWDILFEIKTDEMRSLTPADRIGKHLSEIIGDNGERADIGGDYKLDVELWHRGTRQSGYDALEEVAKLFKYSGDTRNRILDSYVGDVLCKARIAVTGRALVELLKLDIVAEVDRPRPPQLMVSSVESATARDSQFRRAHPRTAHDCA
nr:hypothetical protein [Oscillatoria laete-virens]